MEDKAKDIEQPPEEEGKELAQPEGTQIKKKRNINKVKKAQGVQVDFTGGDND